MPAPVATKIFLLNVKVCLMEMLLLEILDEVWFRGFSCSLKNLMLV